MAIIIRRGVLQMAATIAETDEATALRLLDALAGLLTDCAAQTDLAGAVVSDETHKCFQHPCWPTDACRGVARVLYDIVASAK